MKEVIYDQLVDKYPSGAVTNDKKISICLRILNNINFNNIELKIFNDLDEHNVTTISMVKNGNYKHYNIYSCELESQNIGIYYYYFKINFYDNSKFISQVDYEAKIVDFIHPWQLTVYDKNYKTPDWVKGGIMYQIFPDRFAKDINFIPETPVNEDERIIHDNWNNIPNSKIDTKNYSAKDFFMGNLKGILNMKDYLKKFNVDMIYLNPIFESSENHRYSTSDYYKIDPYLGDNKLFEQFCKSFKEDNVNIILDGVFSHTGSDSIYFNKNGRYKSIGAYNSTDSIYYPWFKFYDYPNSYDSWWGFDNLPTLIKENEDYMNYIFTPETGVINYWQNLGIKGWRLDVVDELPDIFVDKIRETAKRKDEDCFILGEVWEDASNKHSYGYRRKYLLGEQLDSVMNYPWKNAIIEFMYTNNATKFKNQIGEIINNYPIPSLDCLMNILSTHDTERIITNLGVDIASIPYEDRKYYTLTKEQYKKSVNKLKLAAFLQFTLPGVPSIYYGDEIGMQGFSDPFNRLCFDLNKADENLMQYYIQLSEFRHKNKENFISGFKFDESNNSLISYYRNDILCIINSSDEPIIFKNEKSGEWLFGNKKPYFTEYGIVLASNSYVAIKINR